MIRTTAGISSQTIVWAHEFGQFLATEDRDKRQKELTTSQLRRFFGLIKRLQARDYDPVNHRAELLMLSPQLAYAVGRQRKKERQQIVDPNKIVFFHQEVAAAVNAVQDEDPANEKIYFRNFVNLVETVVAYHKFYGGE